MAVKNTMAIDTVPLPDRTIRVTVPAKVAFDLAAIQKIQGSILDRLGCAACCSGHDIRFDIARSYMVDEKLNIKEIIDGGFIDR